MIELPDDFRAFAAFLAANEGFDEALQISIDTENRYYRDPPEFVTVVRGQIDGLHWGYWFDEPGKSPPVVASYYHSDAYEIREEGDTLFEAIRKHLEQYQRDDDGDEEEENNETYAEIRSALIKAGGPKSKKTGDDYLDALEGKISKRKTIAETRNRMGIVAPKSSYVALPNAERWTIWNYEPTRPDVERDVAIAREHPGTALKLGHDLWPFPEFADASHAMLRLAYEGLKRPPLIEALERAIAWKQLCDAQR